MCDSVVIWHHEQLWKTSQKRVFMDYIGLFLQPVKVVHSYKSHSLIQCFYMQWFFNRTPAAQLSAAIGGVQCLAQRLLVMWTRGCRTTCATSWATAPRYTKTSLPLQEKKQIKLTTSVKCQFSFCESRDVRAESKSANIRAFCQCQRFMFADMKSFTD